MTCVKTCVVEMVLEDSRYLIRRLHLDIVPRRGRLLQASSARRVWFCSFSSSPSGRAWDTAAAWGGDNHKLPGRGAAAIDSDHR